MPIDLSVLRDDPATLQQMLREVMTAAAQQQATLQGTVNEREAEIEKLQMLIQRLLRQQFGRRSEKLGPEPRLPVLWRRATPDRRAAQRAA